MYENTHPFPPECRKIPSISLKSSTEETGLSSFLSYHAANVNTIKWNFNVWSDCGMKQHINLTV